MKPFELIESLASFRQLTDAEILAHPAWRLSLDWNGEDAVLRTGGVLPAAAVWLDVRFEREECVLGIVPSPKFPDFSALFPIRDQVPPSLMLAVIEKELGPLFQALENAMRREFAVVALREGGAPEGALTAFTAALAGGETLADFALTLTPALVADLGRLDFLDPDDGSVAAHKVKGEMVFAEFDLTAAEIAALKPGDHVLMPEFAEEMPGVFRIDESLDAKRARVVASAPVEVPFAEVIAGSEATRSAALDDLTLKVGLRRIASGRRVRLGEQYALAVEEVL